MPTHKIQVSEAELAIAAAAATSFNVLKALPWDQDPVADAIAWLPDMLDVVDEFGEELLPLDPSVDEALWPVWGMSDPAEIVRRVLPDHGACGLWRYYLFDYASDPRSTDATAVLEGVADALRSRWLGGQAARLRPIQIGSIICGPLGVIRASRPLELSVPWGVGSLAEYQWAAGERRGEMHGHNSHWKSPPPVWSEAWSKWRGRHGPIREVDTDGRIHLDIFRSWFPPETDEPTTPWWTKLRDWHTSLWRDICGLSKESLQTLLKEHFEERRGQFFEGVNWELAADGRRLLEAGGGALCRDGLAQVLALANRPELIARAATLGLLDSVKREGYRSFIHPSFAENLADSLVSLNDAATLDIHQFGQHAKGGDRDRLLHHIVKRGPGAILKSHLETNSRFACLLAKETCAPARFHHPAEWDPSEPDQVVSLAEHIGMILAEEALPPLPDQARPLTPPASSLAADALKNWLNQGRRRAEWLFKIAIAHQATLQLSWRKATEKPGQACGVLKPVEQEVPGTTPLAGSRSPGDPLDVAVDRRSLQDLVRQTCLASGANSEGVPHHLLDAEEAMAIVRRSFESLGVAAAGNLGSHDSNASLADLRSAAKVLLEFDRVFLGTPFALPSFAHLTRLEMRPNVPVVLELRRIDGLPHSGDDVREHYWSGDWFGLSAGRVYSCLDMTRNRVSVNPIIIDWTDWLAGGRLMRSGLPYGPGSTY